MENLPRFFFALQNNIQMYHWQTDSYARHKATCKLLAAINPLIDNFMETYQGKYGRVPKGNTIVKVMTLTESTAVDFVKKSIQFLNNILEEDEHIKASDTDLLNIRDEMVSVLNTTLYLFTLN
jgi:hypothetical protein